ncbi:SRPBCC family protein [Leucobacter rhizosphaerae]|uniref:SRPBCC family protein n=1 Tax=Leucobacter rhizosphaerae TaxID=2932245 RepID=A0ABY4FTP9_9MICO|nr:SRPBCC family protein [Leucobacter rhizosphaerae]UOQ59637.1 SRPBCC family protein [Leucobacter rhizosphaerae]
MASTFTITTEGPIDVDAVFSRSLDIGLHIRSMAHSNERAVGGVTSGQIGLGECVTWRARHFGVWFTMTSRITELERPHRFVDEQVSGPFKMFRHEHRFEPTSAGTRMTDTLTIASPVFGIIAERLVLVPYLRRLITARNRVVVAIPD